MPQERTYSAPDVDPADLADELAGWLRRREFETQVLPVEGGGVLIQGRQTEGWKSLLGMSLATNVVIARNGPSLCVEVGQGKWMDKAVVGAVGLLLLWPALVPAAIGAWRQSQLPEEIFEQVSRYLARYADEPFSAEPPAHGASAPSRESTQPAYSSEPLDAPLPTPVFPVGASAAEPTAAETVACPSCGQPVRAGTRFCENCGQAMADQEQKSAQRFCANCGAALSPTARFCSECGTPAASE